MLKTIPDRIADEIESRLLQITSGDEFEIDVSEVVRPTRRGENWQRKHLGIGILQQSSERVTELDCPGNPPAICYAVTFEIVGVCRDSIGEQDPKSINENALAAAIVKAITTPAPTWHNFNGVAINAEIGEIEVASSGDGEMNSVTIPFRVFYRVSENDPYTVRG
jgi:hypothetical protein